MAWGLELPRDQRWNPQRDFISEVESSPNGNTILRISREHRYGYDQIAHVVLSPTEHDSLITHLMALDMP